MADGRRWTENYADRIIGQNYRLSIDHQMSARRVVTSTSVRLQLRRMLAFDPSRELELEIESCSRESTLDYGLNFALETIN
jgi:hypothetical protein